MAAGSPPRRLCVGPSGFQADCRVGGKRGHARTMHDAIFERCDPAGPVRCAARRPMCTMRAKAAGAASDRERWTPARTCGRGEARARGGRSRWEGVCTAAADERRRTASRSPTYTPFCWRRKKATRWLAARRGGSAGIVALGGSADLADFCGSSQSSGAAAARRGAPSAVPRGSRDIGKRGHLRSRSASCSSPSNGRCRSAAGGYQVVSFR